MILGPSLSSLAISVFVYQVQRSCGVLRQYLLFTLVFLSVHCVIGNFEDPVD